MRTRSKKIALENAGGIPSPPQQLPAVQKRTRAPRKKASRAQQEPSIGTEDSKNPNSEAASSSFVPNVHPVQTRAPTTRLPVPSRLPGPSRPLRVRTPSAFSVAPAAQTPTSLAPQSPQALIHIWVDASAEDLASAQPVSDPTILVAVPSDAIPRLLTFIGTLSHRHNELTISAAITTISISPSSNKRKLPADADLPPLAQRARIEPTPAPVRPKARRAFSRDGLAEVRLEPNLQPRPVSHYQPSDTIPDTKFFKRVNRYGPDGNLQLGLEPVSISSEEGSNALFQPSRPVTPPLEIQPATNRPEETASSDHGPLRDIVEEIEITDNVTTETSIAALLRPEHSSAPETPRGRGSRWGLGTLVNTARRYLPSLNRRAELLTPVAENRVIAPNSISTFSPDVVIRSTLTDPNKPKDQSAKTVNAPATTAAAQSHEHQERRERPERRKHREHNKITSPKRGNKTRNHVQSDRRNHGDNSQAYYIRAQALDARRKAEMATTPGTKRKRLPSPDTIPNPRGSSYGMDLDYFGYDSSDEDDEMDNTPTKPRPSKSRRIGVPGDSDSSMIGDPQNARPYSGILFAESSPAYHGGNVFGEVKTAEKAMRMASDTRVNESQRQAYLSKTSSGRKQHAPPATPISNQTGSFKVPEPSDSESDPEESPRVTSLSGNEKGSSKGKNVPRQMEAPPTTVPGTSTGKSPGLWKKSPPPRPTPGHKALPSASKPKAPETLSSSSHPAVTSNSGSTSSGSRLPAHRVAPPPVNRSTDSEALRKVREKALQHKPRKPSTLSQSSRLYSSPLGDSSEEASKSTSQGVAAAQKNIGGKELSTAGAGTGLDGASNDDETPKNTGHNEVAAIPADKDFTGTINVDGDSSAITMRVSPPDRSATWNAYKDYCQKTNPAVAGLLAETEVNVNAIGDMLKSGITDFTTNAKAKGKEVVANTTSSSIESVKSPGCSETIR